MTSTIDKRARLIQTAARLSYEQGFGRTSLAHIAKGAKVPLGNVYYYFKTKDEIGEAIVEERLAAFHELTRRLDQLDSPRERLVGFVHMTFTNRERLAESGCPHGTLCSELNKGEGGPLTKKSARLFSEPLAWMEAQFKALGKRSTARVLAVHLLSALEGVAVLAHALNDPKLVAGETNRLKDWIRNL